MTEPANSNGAAGKPAGPQQLQIQVRVLGQYIKDLSFESPNIRKLLSGAPENPNLNLEINVHPEQVGPDVYETALVFTGSGRRAISNISGPMTMPPPIPSMPPRMPAIRQTMGNRIVDFDVQMRSESTNG